MKNKSNAVQRQRSPKISVIVAVYNVAAMMRRGIDSILAQTLRDIEVLLVDDGSTDESVAICDEYAKMDSRVRVLHEPHRGVWATRQVGIDNVLGEYSIHLDPDDYAEPMMLEEMLCCIEENCAEMLLCDYYEETSHETIMKSQKPQILDSRCIVNSMIGGEMIGSLWNKLIRTSCYKQWKIRFPQGLSVREDIVVVCDLLQHIRKVCYLSKAFYHYDRTGNINSLTAHYSQDTAQCYAQEILWHKAFLRNALLDNENKSCLEYGLMNLAYTTLRRDLFTKSQWHDAFGECRSTFLRVASDYKRFLVMLAMDGHYHAASAIRTLLAILKKNENRNIDTALRT